MSNVRRVYVEKKEAYAVKAKELQEEIKSYLGITSVTGVRVLIRYDVENISEATYQLSLIHIFYLMDAYEDLEKDLRKKEYNPFESMVKNSPQDFETLSKLILTSMMSECSKSFERLPILQHASIIRNILYSGV